MSRSKKTRSSAPLVWAEIDLDNLRHNLVQIRKTLKNSGADLLAIVKADAYGHGMAPVARTLAREGVRFFGVATLDEALALRRLLPKATILVLGSFHPDQVQAYARARVRPTVSSMEDLLSLESSLKRGQLLDVHVKVDTGMGRLGVWHEIALPFLLRSRISKKIRVEGLYTHLSSADDAQDDFSRLQLHRFETLLEKLRPLKILPKYIHALNSSGLMRFPKAHWDLVRPGILLYGLNPWRGGRLPVTLKPVMSLKARISYLKDVGRGRLLSYGRTYETPSPTKIATLPVGYSHGYRVGLSNKGFVLVRGQKCPVVGRVTMDQTLVDVGHVKGVSRWDVATLIGEDRGHTVRAEEMAEQLGTIPYEVVCSVHGRIPRIYKGLR